MEVSVRRATAATAAIAAVIGVVVLGGYAVGGALARPAGPPVVIAGAVHIQPLTGWEVAGAFPEPPGVRLTRGGANLDVVALPFGGTASDLARRYVRSALEPQARRLSVSPSVEPVRLSSGLEGVRISYVGVFGRAQAPIEGEVTAVVSPSGIGIVFDGWSTEGLLRFALDDVRTMIVEAEVA